MTDARRSHMPRLDDRLPLGVAGLEVSPFCVGIVEDPATVATAFVAGINFFFLTADLHWPLYEATRRGLATLLERVPRERVVVAAASYVTQPEFCSGPFREVVDAVPGLGTLDLLVAGGAYGHELHARWPVYQRHRAERFLGAQAVGASFHDRRAALAAVNGGDLDCAFVRYNSGHPGAQRDIFPHLLPGRTTRLYGFTTTNPHDPGRAIPDDVWRPDITDHYRFALSRIGLDGLLCAPGKSWMVKALDEALALGPLSLEEEEHMIALAADDGD